MTVTGIYRATPLRVNPRMRNVKAVYKTYIDVVHFRKTDKKKLHERDSDRFVFSLLLFMDISIYIFLYIIYVLLDYEIDFINAFFYSQVTFTEERIEYLKGLSAMPDIYERLATALGKKT